jgi:hypothetical protein
MFNPPFRAVPIRVALTGSVNLWQPLKGSDSSVGGEGVCPALLASILFPESVTAKLKCPSWDISGMACKAMGLGATSN